MHWLRRIRKGGAAAVDESADVEDPDVAAVKTAIDSFYDSNYKLRLFSTTHADYQAANDAFDAILAQLKKLSGSQKIELGASYYSFILYYLAEQVGRAHDLTSTSAKVYGMTTGINEVVDKIGAFPDDWQKAIDVVGKIYVKVNGTLFNSSFNFQKVDGGYDHFDATVPEIAKLSPEGVKFAQYMYPSGDGWYIYASSPTSANTYLTTNIISIVMNYYQDKNTDSGSNPSSVSYSTFLKYTSSTKTAVWKDGQNGATYKSAYESALEKYNTDTTPNAKLALDKLAEIFGSVFGGGFKDALNNAYKVGYQYFSTGKADTADIEDVNNAIAAITDEPAATVLGKILDSSSLILGVNLTYPLGADAYNETSDATEVYNNQIKINTYT
ncbi:MAG: hypothetical protein LUG21_08695, partial [Clostridiales bacterium]|nr:hypothetical protein [Clostridiales bacterium]